MGLPRTIRFDRNLMLNRLMLTLASSIVSRCLVIIQLPLFTLMPSYLWCPFCCLHYRRFIMDYYRFED
jgi:hypothetical protein